MRLCAFFFPPDWFILQGYALMALQMVVNTLGFGIVKQQK